MDEEEEEEHFMSMSHVLLPQWRRRLHPVIGYILVISSLSLDSVICWYCTWRVQFLYVVEKETIDQQFSSQLRSYDAVCLPCTMSTTRIKKHMYERECFLWRSKAEWKGQVACWENKRATSQDMTFPWKKTLVWCVCFANPFLPWIAIIIKLTMSRKSLLLVVVNYEMTWESPFECKARFEKFAAAASS